MIYVSDIEDDLARGDVRGIETAFRALVDFPREEEIRGADSPKHLEDLLQRVAVALEMDDSAMPASTVAAVQAAFDDPLYERSDYAAGSTIVRRFQDHWRALFEANFQVRGRA